MTKLVTIQTLDEIKPVLQQGLQEAKQLMGMDYCNVRIQLCHTREASAECGKEKALFEDMEFTLGVKVVGGEKSKAVGYFGQVLGRGDLENIPKILRQAIRCSYERAIASAEQKHHLRQNLGIIATSLYDCLLAPVEIHEACFQDEIEIDPDTVSRAAMMDMTRESSLAIQALSPEIRFNRTWVKTQKVRKLFIDTAGINLDQIYVLSQGIGYVVAGDVGQEQWDVMGDRRGWEVLLGKNVYGQSFHDFSLELARKALRLSQAPVLDVDPNKEVVVVTDPHYNALLVHEICGHPTEADRILKMETAYAGRSWFFRSFKENEIDKRVAAEGVSVYSDPTIEGYGRYPFDEEGVIAHKVALIENGRLKDFMQSRETAYHLQMLPNGCMRANNASLVPLVRMNNLVFGNGSTPPEKIIAEVEDGYYLKGHRIPSISESRENFSITCQEIYRIQHGQLGQLYRQGGMTSDSGAFLMQVDAVGNDFRNYPIPNCGKGVPMQCMQVGNGGPTLRSRARLTGSTLPPGKGIAAI